MKNRTWHINSSFLVSLSLVSYCCNRFFRGEAGAHNTSVCVRVSYDVCVCVSVCFGCHSSSHHIKDEEIQDTIPVSPEDLLFRRSMFFSKVINQLAYFARFCRRCCRYVWCSLAPVIRFSTTRLARANRGFAQLARASSRRELEMRTTSWPSTRWERIRGKRWESAMLSVDALCKAGRYISIACWYRLCGPPLLRVLL